MKLRLRRWIFFALILSSFFVFIFGGHGGGPWMLFHFFTLLNLPEILTNSDFGTILSLISVSIGQFLFLYLGWKTVTGYKLWLLLVSPLLVLIPLLIMLTELIEFETLTRMSAIPFSVMVVIFYIECTMKLSISGTKNMLNL